MLTTVGTLCACIALSAAPANAQGANKPAAPATPKVTQKAAVPAPQTVKTKPSTATAPSASKPAPAATTKQPTTAHKPVVTDAAKQQATPQQRVANKPVTPNVLPLETAVIERTNQERVRRGLRPLALDFGLLASARKHAAWMTRRHSLQHTNQPVAENIAMGQNSSDEVVRDWMSSPGHRANILNAGYSRIGVAAYTSTSGTVYWCQQFH